MNRRDMIQRVLAAFAATPLVGSVITAPASAAPTPPTGFKWPEVPLRTVRLSVQDQEVALRLWPADPGEEKAAWKKRAFIAYARDLVEAHNRYIAVL